MIFPSDLVPGLSPNRSRSFMLDAVLREKPVVPLAGGRRLHMCADLQHKMQLRPPLSNQLLEFTRIPDVLSTNLAFFGWIWADKFLLVLLSKLGPSIISLKLQKIRMTISLSKHPQHKLQLNSAPIPWPSSSPSKSCDHCSEPSNMNCCSGCCECCVSFVMPEIYCLIQCEESGHGCATVVLMLQVEYGVADHSAHAGGALP